MITPVGPLPPQVYWRRRALVIVLAVVLLIGLVWFVVSRASKGPSSPSPVAASTASSSDSPLTGVLASPTSSPSTLDSSSAGSASSGSASSGSGSAGSSGSSVSSGASSGPTAASSARPTATPTSRPPASSSAANAPLPNRTSTPTPQATLPSRTSAAPPSTQRPTQRPAPTTGAAPTTSKAPVSTPKPASTPKPTPTSTAPSRDAQGRLLCSQSTLTLTTTTGAASYPSGSKPILGLTVTNSGNQTCTQDVSGSKQVFTVTTPAGRRIWSTTDCFPGTGTDVRTLEPGESLQYNIKWSGTTSQPGCTGTRSPVAAGTYRVTAALGGWAAKPATLVITG